MKYLGDIKNGKYTNIYGNTIKCFKCESNFCTGSKSFSSLHGGNGELLHCQKHEQDAIKEVELRAIQRTISNTDMSGS